MNVNRVLQFSIGPIAGAVLGLISVPMVAWYFSAEDIGRLSILQVTINFILILCSLGLDQAYVREYYASNDKLTLLKTCLLPGLVILIPLLVLTSFSPFSLSSLLFDVDSIYLSIILFFGIFSSFFARYISLILRMGEQGVAYSLAQALPRLIYLVIIGCYIAVTFSANSESLLLAYVCSHMIAMLVFAWFTRDQWIPIFVASTDRKKLSQMINYGLPLVASGLAFWGLKATDKFFLRAFSSFEELGIYAVALSFSGVALVLQAVFSVVWAPTIYKWMAEGVEPGRIKKFVDLTILGVVVVWSAAGLLSFLVSYVLPSEYKAVESIFVAAMAYPLLYTASEATGVGVGIQRKTFYTMLATFLALTANIIFNYFLIPEYGAAGAAIASALAFWVFFVVRTEVSALVWVSFPRLAMHSLIAIALVASIFSAVPLEFFGKRLIWAGVMIVALIVYRECLFKVYNRISVDHPVRSPGLE
ncbi:lipopolysaccharide biosynthesis protein [Microbulbifer sp. 2304DJ12-6]|uniref:lipopolysaccharide biosynthesis protein n=1 Tax=Microbulbifer sp. 2304DJ12-6 TaxID=3233340 RepID=UPI0039B0A733